MLLYLVAVQSILKIFSINTLILIKLIAYIYINFMCIWLLYHLKSVHFLKLSSYSLRIKLTVFSLKLPGSRQR